MTQQFDTMKSLGYAIDQEIRAGGVFDAFKKIGYIRYIGEGRELIAAIKAKDFVNAALIAEKILVGIGYPFIGNTVHDIVSKIDQGDWLEVVRTVLHAALNTLDKLSPETSGVILPKLTMGQTAIAVDDESALVSAACELDVMPTASADGEEIKTEFGVIETTAIIGLILKVLEFRRKRKQDQSQ